MSDIGGQCDQGYGAVADAFRANFAERGELGAACAVVVDGNVVVDLWGGHRDKKRTLPWHSDTLVTVFSTSKGMAAAALAVAHSRGLFELDEPVCTYWPEFGAAGKGDVTVRQLLRHQAGLAVIDTKIDLEMLADLDRLGNVLAEQAPGWTPGSTWGYHAQSIGWYESQLLRRVDPQGRAIGAFFQQEVADVLGVEFYMGLPESVSQHERVARLVGGTVVGAALRPHKVPFPVLRRLANPFSPTSKAFMNPKALTKAQDVNKPEILKLELPSVNGTGTARAIATVYGDLAAGGTRLGVADSTLREIEAPIEPGFDQIFGIDSAFSFGFMKPFPLLAFGSPRAFGHTGVGGSFGFADPEQGLGYSYVMNKAGYSVPEDEREIALRNAVRSCI